MNGNTQRQQITAIHEHLEKGHALIVFPAGEVSRLGFHGISDGKWNHGFLRLASQHRGSDCAYPCCREKLLAVLWRFIIM